MIKWIKHLIKERYYGDLIGWQIIIYLIIWIIYGVIKYGTQIR